MDRLPGRRPNVLARPEAGFEADIPRGPPHVVGRGDLDSKNESAAEAAGEPAYESGQHPKQLVEQVDEADDVVERRFDRADQVPEGGSGVAGEVDADRLRRDQDSLDVEVHGADIKVKHP